MDDELEVEGGLQSRWTATLDRKTEDRKTIENEFVQADALLKRLGPILKSMYKAKVDKDFDFSTPDYAVQSAANAGYRKALKDVYGLLYPEVE